MAAPPRTPSVAFRPLGIRNPARSGLRRRRARLAAWSLAAALAFGLACGSSSPPAEMGTSGLVATPVVSGLSSPVWLTAPPGDPRLFVVEQRGTIRIVKDGSLLPEPFLDLRPAVASGGERGLLGLAFHPDYASNGRFYVDYTDPQGDTRVVAYRVSASDPDRADPASGDTILAVDQPYSNHNGGLVTFGPDGMLYVGLGDGGSGGDPRGNGQNRGTLLGAILRLDVDGGSPYRIPPDNPFVGQAGFRGEIWAWGLRNPWRYSFDPASGLLYIADVGQNDWEEVDAVSATTGGLNYGWNVMEGRHCYGSSSCDGQGLVQPILEYGHDQGCSITGGFVYRGSAMPDLQGTYFYSDYCSGWLRSLRYDGTAVGEERSWDVGSLGQVLSFGEDAAGELYVLSANGTVYRLDPGS
ncbi:MAG: PQQ-dependent sugar dehydrogenase [Candidatus Palauibacterales bacterium]|nr:PQQ-dependent sugar dehydrogenase [Candidatus Palauibacterales bacterium]